MDQFLQLALFILQKSASIQIYLLLAKREKEFIVKSSHAVMPRVRTYEILEYKLIGHNAARATEP